MIVAEMRSAHMPMEILGLEIERKHIGEQRIEGAGNIAARIVAEIGRRLKRRLAALFNVLIHHCTPYLNSLGSKIRQAQGHGEGSIVATAAQPNARGADARAKYRCASPSIDADDLDKIIGESRRPPEPAELGR